MSKPLDCVGTSGPVGKHDFHETVHRVESGVISPPIIRSRAANLQVVAAILRRGRANGCRLHPAELDLALECLEDAEGKVI